MPNQFFLFLDFGLSAAITDLSSINYATVSVWYILYPQYWEWLSSLRHIIIPVDMFPLSLVHYDFLGKM